ncbi:hypothetical protein SKAU_G00292770 [Synaphobranchus kaupii]|uniref:Uncharacterized protein n=1 Tax=Synaphobranchus kaupii TaxID=118154 RepID=A0A9Q1EU37_SYNKA|nr:hypothetical protein SKAU_G00292770 [Synaphobranchus kaupii]
MSSEATPVQQGAPQSLLSPGSPISPSSLALPKCRTRDRSPSPMRGYLIPSPPANSPNPHLFCNCTCIRGAPASPVSASVSHDPKATASSHHLTAATTSLCTSQTSRGSTCRWKGDEVSYKICCIPPKMEKVQAVEVTITHLAPGSKHETWSGNVVSS